jgi:hypothetical protein
VSTVETAYAFPLLLTSEEVVCFSILSADLSVAKRVKKNKARRQIWGLFVIQFSGRGKEKEFYLPSLVRIRI